MAIKLSGIARLGVVLIALVWASVLSDTFVHAQYQPASTPSQESIDAVSAGIVNMQQQVTAIQEQVTVTTAGLAPSAATLDQIQIQINSIRNQKDEISIQVAQIVSARAAVGPQTSQINYDQVSQALSLIQQSVQVIAREMQVPQVVSVTAIPVASAADDLIEAQIGAIRQKIAELTRQQQSLEQNPVPAQPAVTGETPAQTIQSEPSAVSCDASTGICSAVTPATETAPAPAASKGFWQTIIDFIRNLFTF